MSNEPRTAVLHRMVMPGHTCPYGLKARHLLKSRGYAVEDVHLVTREEVDAFKARHGVATTPQTFIDGVRIGGYDDLRRHFGLKVADPSATSYRPVIALFAMTALMAMAAGYAVDGAVFAGGSVPDRPFEVAPFCQDAGQSFAMACQAALRTFVGEDRGHRMRGTEQ